MQNLRMLCGTEGGSAGARLPSGTPEMVERSGCKKLQSETPAGELPGFRGEYK